MEKNDFGCRAAGISRLFIMVSVFLCASIYRVDAQSFSVSGTVTGAGGGNEIGVVVFVKGDQSNGTMTDEDGRYSIDVPDNGSVLVFSLLGYKTMEVPVAGRSVVNVQLEEESTVLDEVLVVGYGFDDRVGESLPAYSAVGSRGSGPDCKYGVEQEDTLAGPSFKIAAGWRLRACIRENLFVNILKGRRQCHSVLDGE